MLTFLNTNIINNERLNSLVMVSADIFKSREVYTGDHTLTAFRILAYWGFHHRDTIEDQVLFLEMCADELKANMEMYDAAVLLLNPTVPNFFQVGFDLDEASILSAKLTEANYVFDPDDIQSMMTWAGFQRRRISGGVYKIYLRLREVTLQDGQIVDFKEFAHHA